jgi:Leucine Rich repeat
MARRTVLTTTAVAVGLILTQVMWLGLVRADSGTRRHHNRQTKSIHPYESSAPDASSPSLSSAIDLSGLHSLRGSPMLEEALRGFLLSHHARMRASRQRPTRLEKGDSSGLLNDGKDESHPSSVAAIDVSQSALRDDDFDMIVNALFPTDDANATNVTDNESGVEDVLASSHDEGNVDAQSKEEAVNLHLTAYGNQLTGGAVQKLALRILDYNHRCNASRQDGNEAAAASTENSTARSASDSNSTSNEEADPSHTLTSIPSSVPSRSHPLHNMERRMLECLDLSWNPLFLSDPPANRKKRRGKGSSAEDKRIRSTTEALQLLVAMPALRTLRLDCCGLDPAHCRSLAKGLLDRYPAEKLPVSIATSDASSSLSHACDDLEAPRPFSLHLSGNGAVGDAGAAALAAALRTLVRRHTYHSSSSSSAPSGPVVLETLDLSNCGIGDVGAEALAVALESHRSTGYGPVLLIRRLNLSHNRISSIGAAALGRALQVTPTQGPSGSPTTADTPTPEVVLLGLDLSDNKDVGDKGAAGIAGAVASGRLPCVSMRSCNIYADGAAAFGTALRRAAVTSTNEVVEVDLSGNPLGVLRGKKKEDGKYSASRLKSKASATAASYVNQGMSFLRKNLKDVGVDVAPFLGGTSAESDDEEEKASEDSVEDEYDPSKGRCGAKAMANAFIEASDEECGSFQDRSVTRVRLGLRHCCFDHSAADALAAMLVTARSKLNFDFDIDVTLNTILEEEMVSALEGDNVNEHLLQEMAERHQDALDALKEARSRAAQASAAAAARVRVRADGEYDAEWEAGGIRPTYDDDEDDDEDDIRDSDADYEDE